MDEREDTFFDEQEEALEKKNTLPEDVINRLLESGIPLSRFGVNFSEDQRNKQYLASVHALEKNLNKKCANIGAYETEFTLPPVPSFFRQLEAPSFIFDNQEQLAFYQREDWSTKDKVPYERFGNFIDASLMLRNKTVDYAENPHTWWRYVKNLGELDEEQLAWYLYWRDALFAGTPVQVEPTCLSLFIKELINYSFDGDASITITILFYLYEIYAPDYLDGVSLKQLIGDMLYEAGDATLANELSPPWNYDTPKLYQKFQEGIPLEKISITIWHRYNKNRKTPFFKQHKTRIYKLYKEAVKLINQYYVATYDKPFYEDYFIMSSWKEQQALFRGWRLERRHVETREVEHEYVKPTKEVSEQVTYLFRVIENMVRMEQGARQLPMTSSPFPEGVIEELPEVLRIAEAEQKERKKRKRGQKKVVEEPIEPRKPLVFDQSKIAYLQEEQRRLIDEVSLREAADLVEETFEEEVQLQVTDHVEPESISQPFFTESTPTDAASFFTQQGGAEEELEELVTLLSQEECTFIQAVFANASLGRTANITAEALNEKAMDTIGDVLLEKVENTWKVIDEYHLIQELIKE